ncbi:MAG: hypothetical protein ABSG75_15805 [Syntrophales bacterium]|jgi:hypothetical protein
MTEEGENNMEKKEKWEQYRTKEIKKCIIVAMITLQKGDLLIKHGR